MKIHPLQYAGLFASLLASSAAEHHHHFGPIKSVAVIGAGPAGLQAAATLVQHGFDTVRLFERQEAPGGTWYYRDEVPIREPYPDVPIENAAFFSDVRKAGTVVYYREGDEGLSLAERWAEAVHPSPVWKSLTTNTPGQITGLPDVSWPKDAPWVLTAHAIQRNVRTYASFHGLNSNDAPLNTSRPITSYSTRVESLKKVGSHWRLYLRKLERLPESKEIRATWWEEEFDTVVVASGGYDSPHVPNIPGLVEWSGVRRKDGTFPVWHTQRYRTPEQVKGKTVLLLGASVSASGISNDIGPHVAKLLVSVRPGNRTGLFQRRSFRRIYPGAEIVPEVAEFESLDSLTSIKDGRIALANGTVLTDIDEVILATGFRHANSFLGDLANGTISGSSDPDVRVHPVITEGKQGQFRNLDWRGFYIPDPTLAFTSVRAWTIGRYQALAFAKVWEGTAQIETVEQQWKEYPGHGRSFFSRSFGTQQAEAAYRKYVGWLNNESLKHGGRLVDTYPVEQVSREEFTYYAGSAVGYWDAGVISKANFTDAEDLPEKEWSADPSVEIFWSKFIDNEEEY